jgi:hypothetical protein
VLRSDGTQTDRGVLPVLCTGWRAELPRAFHAARGALKGQGDLRDKGTAEDDDKRAHDEIQKLTNAYMDKIDQAAKTKEKEILEIK